MYLERLKACGANSIRVWDENEAEWVLNEARRLGMTVMLGIWMEREYEGFDYNDRPARDAQFARVRQTILKYRHHPALLLWSVGNEVALEASNLAVYDDVNRITKLIHELDPGHPVTTALSPDSERSVWLLRERCPDLDILSVNAYGETPLLTQYMRGGGWTGPYLLSEFGPRGYWQVPYTTWGTPIEPNSEQKCEFVRLTYPKYIGSQPPDCLGAYLFVWGSKQEETHTWFSFFDKQGRESPLVATMQQLWSGRQPANRAPVVQQLLVDYYETGSLSFPVSTLAHRAEVRVTDPDGDSLTYHWDIRPVASTRADYDNTELPPLPGLIQADNAPLIQFRLPRQPGSYRLFVYIYDTHRHVATANLPFRVEAASQSSTGQPAETPTP
jgi:hypothetical protein